MACSAQRLWRVQAIGRNAMYRLLTSALLWMSFAFSAVAQSDVLKLTELLRIPEIMDVMRAEGRTNGDEMAAEMFPGRDTGWFSDQIDAIYDVDWMLETYEAAFSDAMAGADLSEAIVFWESDLGRRIITLELTGRQALLEDAVSERVVDSYHGAVEHDDPRLDLIRRYVVANALIEQNVEGALNSNFAFMAGLAGAGGVGADLTSDQMLRDVWSQEPQIRADTEEWLMSYLFMAYRPLTDQEIEAYIAFSLTDAGQRMNAALFSAFDTMYNDLSYALGEAVGKFSQGEDI